MNPCEEIEFVINGLEIRMHIRIVGTTLYHVVRRNFFDEDLEVKALERIIEHKDYSDPWTQGVIHEGRLALKADIDRANAWLEGVAA